MKQALEWIIGPHRGMRYSCIFCAWHASTTFIETLPWSMKRNPRLFNGHYISITRQDDGTLRPNFKPMKMDEMFNVDNYAFEVYRELRKALTGLVEEK